jgi:GTPase SAR1 family protein
MTPAYYRGTHGVIVVYDVTSAQSFASLKRWFQEIGKLAGPPYCFRSRFKLDEYLQTKVD